MDWLRQYAEHDVDQHAQLAASQRAARVTTEATVTRLARAVNQLDTEMAKLTREYTRGVIPEVAYVSTRDELVAERAVAQAALDEVATRPKPSSPSPQTVAVWLQRWEELDVADRNRICRQLLRVVVARGPWRSDVVTVPAWEWAPPPRVS